MSRKELMLFYHQLATLQDSGLPILRCLRVLEEQAKPGHFRHTLTQMTRTIRSGATLADAMGRHPGVFDTMHVKMIAAGEAGGVLGAVLERLADFIEQIYRLRRRILFMMIYPAAVVVTAILVAALLVHLAGGSAIAVLLVPLVAIAAAGILVHLARSSEAGRLALDRVILTIPIIRTICRKTSLARFARTLGTLVQAGVPIVEATGLCRDATGNRVVSRTVGQVHDAVRQGHPLAGPLRASRLLDPMIADMVEVGEETGELDRMLLKVADNYEEEVDLLITATVSLIKPTIIVIIAIVVGIIVVNFYAGSLSGALGPLSDR